MSITKIILIYYAAVISSVILTEIICNNVNPKGNQKGLKLKNTVTHLPDIAVYVTDFFMQNYSPDGHHNQPLNNKQSRPDEFKQACLNLSTCNIYVMV